MNKLQRKRVEKWVAALRSGKYKQGKEALTTTAGYCCLGVACELALEAGVRMDVEFKEAKHDADYGEWSYDGQTGMLPEAVANWLGIAVDVDDGTNGYDVRIPKYEGDTDVSVAIINDGDASFKKIATLIERTFLKEKS